MLHTAPNTKGDTHTGISFSFYQINGMILYFTFFVYAV